MKKVIKISILNLILFTTAWFWQGCEPDPITGCVGDELFNASAAFTYQESNHGLVLRSSEPLTCPGSPGSDCGQIELKYDIEFGLCNNSTVTTTASVFYNYNSSTNSWSVDTSTGNTTVADDGDVIMVISVPPNTGDVETVNTTFHVSTNNSDCTADLDASGIIYSLDFHIVDGSSLFLMDELPLTSTSGPGPFYFFMYNDPC